MPGGFNFKPYEQYVQQGMVDGAHASGAFTLIAAGPPRLLDMPLSDIGQSALAFPIGMIQNMSLSHSRQFNRVFEIGSERSYHISGRTVGQLGLGRVLYHGPSFLRALYAYYLDARTPVVVPPFTALSAAAGVLNPNPHNVKIRPGYSNLYLNLASDLFSQPIGLLIKTMDSNESTIGAVYAEACYVPSHGISTDSQGLMVQEQVSLQFERLVPVRTNMLDLIQSALENVATPSAPAFGNAGTGDA